MLEYKGYGMDKVYDDLHAFAKARVQSDAMPLAGANFPARDYTWSVMLDGMERNSTQEERIELHNALLDYCFDCGGEVKTGELPVLFGCSHLAHMQCHNPGGEGCWRGGEYACEYEDMTPLPVY